MKKILPFLIVFLFFFLPVKKVAGQTTPPSHLDEIITEASGVFNTPQCVLQAVAWIEGGHMWGYSNQQIDQYSQPGSQDPHNCQPNPWQARGPMQFTPSQWERYKNSSGRTNPHICNIYDSVYAASAKLSNDSRAASSNWTETEIRNAGRGYYGACHDCGSDPSQSQYADCRRLNMSYCDFLVSWCGGSISDTPTPNPPSPALTDFGFNVHSLSKESEEFIYCLLSWLADNCQTTYVRLWAYQETLGINGYADLEKVLNAAPANIKFIVALEDFPFGPPVGNPTSWFSSGYQEKYQGYVRSIVERYKNNEQIFVWEIMNEPHCQNNNACLPHLKNFIKQTADLIKNIDPSTHVSPGLMGGHIGWSDYQEISNYSSITANSCHYNSDTNNVDTCLQALNHKGNVSFFYVGEAGYRGQADCSGGGCTNDNCTNCCDLPTLQQRAEAVSGAKNQLSSADAFLIWQFSPPQNSLLICDSFSVFPGDPICLGSEEFTCSPSQPKTVISGPSAGFFDAKLTDSAKTTETSTIAPSPDPNSQSALIKANLLAYILGNSSYKKENVSGKVHYEKIVFPDFSALSRILGYASSVYLPEIVKPSFSGTPIAKVKTLIYPVDKDGQSQDEAATSCEEAPEHEQELKGFRNAALGAVALNGPNLPQAVLDNLQWFEKYDYKIETVDYACPAGFGPGDDTVDDKLPKPKAKKPEFKLAFLTIIKNLLEEVWQELVLKKIFKLETEWKIAFKAHIPTAQTSAQYATSLASTFLPQELIPDWDPIDEAEALTAGGQVGDQVKGTKVRVEVDVFSAGTTSPTGYKDLGRQRNYSCAALCAAHPEEVVEQGKSWVGKAKMCPSCDPEDYEAPFTPIPKPPNWPPHCDWVDAYGCKYYTCKYDKEKYGYTDPNNPCVGCGGGKSPFCEDTGDKIVYCNDQALQLPKDVDHCPDGSPGKKKACYNFGGDCQRLGFPSSKTYYQNHPDQAAARGLTEYIESLPESGPPYGPCFYGNPTVAVQKNGWNDWSGCIKLCNWQCDGETKSYN